MKIIIFLQRFDKKYLVEFVMQDTFFFLCVNNTGSILILESNLQMEKSITSQIEDNKNVLLIEIKSSFTALPNC